MHAREIKASIDDRRVGEAQSSRLVRENDKLTSYIYTNIFLNNNSKIAIAAEYITTQDLPIVPDQQDYQLRIVRLKVPMSTVPLFKFKVGEYFVSFGWTTPNGTPETIEAVTPPQPVIFVPSIANDVPLIHLGSPYDKAVYNIEDFLAMINTAIGLAWADLVAAPPAWLPVGYLNDDNPYFIYDCEIGCIHAILPAVPTDADYPTPFYPALCGTGTQGLVLLMSSDLYSFLNGFQSFYYGPNGLTTTANVNFPNLNWAMYFNADQSNLVSLPQFGACPARFVNEVPQTTSSTYAFQQVSRIIMTTNVALVRESVLVKTDNTNINSTGSGNPLRLEVLTDFEIPQDALSQKQYVYYNGEDNERYHNIKDSGDLRRIDLKVFVQFQDLTIIPLFIAPGHEVNVKLGWRRKFNNIDYQITDTNMYSRSTF